MKMGLAPLILTTGICIGCKESAPPVDNSTPTKGAAADADAGTMPSAPGEAHGCANPVVDSITVKLGQDAETLSNLYPVLSNLPLDPYQQPTRPRGEIFVPKTLNDSIELYTRSSLRADLFTNFDVRADSMAGVVHISATGCNLRDYETQLPAFLAVGVMGFDAWKHCLEDGEACAGMDKAHTCTSPPRSDPDMQCIPWVFYLPLGQPLVNHWGIMFLDYPPADALCASDYQNNFTMNRWKQVLGWGVEEINTIRLSGIVDVHPIAGFGSNESTGIQKTDKYFAEYRKEMLSVVLNPPNLAHRLGYGPGYTLAVMTAGTPSHKAWGEIVGSIVATNQQGKTTKLVPGSSTAWVAMNHPDVTTYNCCVGDRSVACCDGILEEDGKCKGSWSWDLEKDEASDFNAACYFENISRAPAVPFEKFASTCALGIELGQSTLCIQGRRDYSPPVPGAPISPAHCNCKVAAELFCSEHAFNTCPNHQEVTSCEPYNQRANCPKPPEIDYILCHTQ